MIADKKKRMVKDLFPETYFAIFGVFTALILGLMWLHGAIIQRDLLNAILCLLFGAMGGISLIYKYRHSFSLPWRKKKTTKAKEEQ
jgi:hypothetical protein